MLKRFIRQAPKGSVFSRARIFDLHTGRCYRSGKSRCFFDAARTAGAVETDLIEEPMAAALGAGVDVSDAHGNMIVDIGGGTSEVAVIALGDIVTAQSVRVAGDDIDEAIINFIRKKHNMLVGERTAEDIKIRIGSALPYEGEQSIEVRGRNLLDGLPKTIDINSEEVRDAISDTVMQIVDAIRSTLEKNTA